MNAEDFDNAIEYIRLLMSGEYLVAVWSRGDMFTGSVTFQRGATPQPCGNSDGLTLTVKGWHPLE